MGMFDDIVYEMPCPICKEPLTQWQSKSGPCLLEKLTPAQLWERRNDSDGELLPENRYLPEQNTIGWYDACHNCGTWVDIKIQPADIDDGKIPKFGEPIPEYRFGPDLTKAK